MSDHTHDSGSCHDLLSSLSDYIDGTLDDALCVEIETHMADCDNCQVVVDTLRKTVLLYRDLPAEPMPADAEERLFKRMELSEYLNAA